MIETRLLYYFLTVAREQNITKAAKALHITQPTLSRQMTLLEKEVGVPLFRKDSRPIRLTDEGLLLQRRAEEIIELIEKTQGELQARETQIEGTVSIGCGEIAAVRILTEMTAKFSRKYPGVVFDIYTANADQVKQRMDNGITDIGLLLEPADTENYEYIRMPVKERWVVILPSQVPLARKEYVTAKDLEKIPVIMPSRQKIHAEVANWFGDSYDKMHVIGISNLSTNSAQMVRAGMGYALTIEGSLPFRDESEICIRPMYPELYATSVLAWKRDQPFSGAVNAFIQYAKCFLSMKNN